MYTTGEVISVCIIKAYSKYFLNDDKSLCEIKTINIVFPRSKATFQIIKYNNKLYKIKM